MAKPKPNKTPTRNLAIPVEKLEILKNLMGLPYDEQSDTARVTIALGIYIQAVSEGAIAKEGRATAPNTQSVTVSAQTITAQDEDEEPGLMSGFYIPD